jgi:hypothetical protein
LGFEQFFMTNLLMVSPRTLAFLDGYFKLPTCLPCPLPTTNNTQNSVSKKYENSTPTATAFVVLPCCHQPPPAAAVEPLLFLSLLLSLLLSSASSSLLLFSL